MTTDDGTLPEITCHDDFGQPVAVYLKHGTIERGIGYCEGRAVVISAGLLQPGTLASELWQWGDGSGRYWTVTPRGLWTEITPGWSEASGWKLY